MNARRTWLRRAGRLDLGKGETVLWSVAEGRRGRRWRSVRRNAPGGDDAVSLVSSLLIEVDPDGRWTRLELATARGLLTLHPEPGGAAVHGNVVTPHGVEPLAFPWSRRHHLVVAGEPVADAALGSPYGSHPSPTPGLLVERDLTVAAADSLEEMLAPLGGLPGPSWPLEE